MSSLATYLADRKLTHAEFARLLGVQDSTVLRWAKGDRTPTVAWVFAIEKATGGAVPARAWVKRRAVKRPAARRPVSQPTDHS